MYLLLLNRLAQLEMIPVNLLPLELLFLQELLPPLLISRGPAKPEALHLANRFITKVSKLAA